MMRTPPVNPLLYMISVFVLFFLQNKKRKGYHTSPVGIVIQVLYSRLTRVFRRGESRQGQ